MREPWRSQAMAPSLSDASIQLIDHHQQLGMNASMTCIHSHAVNIVSAIQKAVLM